MNTDNTLHLNHTFLPEGLKLLACEKAEFTDPTFCLGPLEKAKAKSLQTNLLTSCFFKVIEVSLTVNQSV